MMQGRSLSKWALPLWLTMFFATACGGTSTAEVVPTFATTQIATTAPVTVAATTTIAPTTVPSAAAYPALGKSASWAIEVLARYPHATDAFTQGLVSVGDRLYESTGLFGESTLREVVLTTGVVDRSESVDAAFFAEGLALVDERLIQLTWQAGIAIVWDASDFREVERFSYDEEGWGLCFDGTQLVMSNGTPELVFRNPNTFEAVGAVTVMRDDVPVERLNELECVGGLVFANVWLTDEIIVIDPADGDVVATIDAGDLVDEIAATDSDDVLNGIAYDADRDVFLLTGKRWPTLFEVRFVAP